MNKKDVSVVRELAGRVAEIAAMPLQEEKRELWRRLNARQPVRAMVMIDNCVHPEYRGALRAYLGISSKGHVPQTLQNAFRMHLAFLESGDMRKVRWI